MADSEGIRAPAVWCDAAHAWSEPEDVSSVIYYNHMPPKRFWGPQTSGSDLSSDEDTREAGAQLPPPSGELISHFSLPTRHWC